ncbi:MAG TPA: hypothetical protein VLX61_03135 [Anaerolineales bacterium]|nr:hypothetical protein [Anaerolineales bacterium]
MTQRSILAGMNQTILIKAGADVTVKGHESERVTAETKGMWGLTLERRSASQIGRARLAAGDHVLFDWRIKMPSLQEQAEAEEVIEVQMGGGGEVLVPFSSNLKIYAGKNIEVRGVKGQVDAYAGLRLNLEDVYCLGNASAGWSMNIDCQTMIGNDVTFGAGSDLRFHVSDLTSARLRVKDIGGYWEARIGAGEKSVYLKCGGDVTFVTDQKVEPLPPNYILGRIEKPAPA